MHCVAHRLELGIGDAIKRNAELSVVADILRKFYKHYKFSPKAVRELAQIADALSEKSRRRKLDSVGPCKGGDIVTIIL